MMFRLTGRKGFHITFENGWTVSVQWGAGNYCDNYHNDDFEQKQLAPDSFEAEVWAWGEDGKALPVGIGDDEWNKGRTLYEDVRGYQSTNQVLDYMVEVSKRKEQPK